MGNREKWLVTLEVMSEYMPNVNIVKDVLNNMKNNGLRVPLPRQEETLLRLFDKSYKNEVMMDEVTRRLEQNDAIQMSKAMNKKFKETQTPEEPKLSKSSLLEEVERRVPIGFKIPSNKKSTLTNYTNRYKMDTSPEARAKRFDELFKDV